MYGCCFDSIQLTQIITLNWVQIPPAMEPPIPDRSPPAPPARPPRAPPAPPVKPPITFPSPPPVLLPFDEHSLWQLASVFIWGYTRSYLNEYGLQLFFRLTFQKVLKSSLKQSLCHFVNIAKPVRCMFSLFGLDPGSIGL